MVRYNSADTIVLWDVEDCRLPDGLNASDVTKNIEMAVKDKGYHGPIVSTTVYGDWNYMKNHFRGFSIRNCPDRVERRQSILMDFLNHAVDTNWEKMNLMLIVGDISRNMGFLGAIRAMKLGGHCNVLLSQPENASEVRISDVSTKWLWNKLATGTNLFHQRRSSQTNGKWLTAET